MRPSVCAVASDMVALRKPSRSVAGRLQNTGKAVND